tara:strand:+ start:574 stop:702 length:129 start_codon:yes stop_codon:yes gene_type:complete
MNKEKIKSKTRKGKGIASPQLKNLVNRIFEERNKKMKKLYAI